MTVGHRTWVLGTKPTSFRKGLSAFKSWAISPPPFISKQSLYRNRWWGLTYYSAHINKEFLDYVHFKCSEVYALRSAEVLRRSTHRNYTTTYANKCLSQAFRQLVGYTAKTWNIFNHEIMRFLKPGEVVCGCACTYACICACVHR